MPAATIPVGSTTRNLESVTRPILPSPPGGIAAFFSCKANQRALEDPDLKQGVFSHFLIQGLSGKADQPLEGEPTDGVVTLSELTSYVSNGTYSYLQKKFDGRRQSPDMKGEFDTTLPLVRLSKLPKEFTNTIRMKLVLIPAGEFEMGSNDGGEDEKPVHRVRISQPFYLQTTEVTQGQWKSVMGTGPWKGKGYVREGANYPAVYVSWDDAKAFCQKLSDRERATYRFSTDAEWEYACRAGTKTNYSFGDDGSRLGDFDWFDKNAWDVGEQYAHLVGQKQSNAWGLSDLHGNVWE